jgi:hypothetical protein
MSMTPLVCSNDAEAISGPGGMSAGYAIELWAGGRPDDAQGRGFVWSRCSGGKALWTITSTSRTVVLRYSIRRPGRGERQSPNQFQRFDRIKLFHVASRGLGPSAITRKGDAGCLEPAHSRNNCADGNARQVRILIPRKSSGRVMYLRADRRDRPRYGCRPRHRDECLDRTRRQ